MQARPKESLQFFWSSPKAVNDTGPFFFVVFCNMCLGWMTEVWG